METIQIVYGMVTSTVPDTQSQHPITGTKVAWKKLCLYSGNTT